MALAEQPNATSTYLPKEIITEILSRLPAKSVLRLRLVCKSWDLLIFDTHFVNKHLSNSSNRNHILFHRTGGGEDLGTFECPLESINPQSRRCRESRIQFPESYSRCSFVGSCNGLVCLNFDSPVERLTEIILWNPSTGDTTRFPRPWPRHNISSFHAFGFGYDYYTNDYKVFIKCNSYVTDMALVYTSSTNSWRRVQDFPDSRLQRSSGCLANGVLHWVVLEYDENFIGESFIVCFDLGTETFETLQLPISVDAPVGDWGGYAAAIELGEIEGYLSYQDRWHNVWIMSEYGVAESWTKIFSFPCYMGFPRRDSIKQLLSLPKDGEVLIHIGELFGFYNAEEKTLKYVFSDCGILNCFGNVIVYADSLVSARVKGPIETQSAEGEDAEEWFSIMNHMLSADF